MLRQALQINTMFAVAVLLLAACDPTTPSQVKTGQIRITETSRSVVVDAKRVNAAQVNIIADDYSRNGKGGVSMVMPYFSGNPLNEITAQKQATFYKEAFAQRGIKDIQVDYVSVDDRALDGQAVVTYISSMALAPEGCSRITGYQGTDTLENLEKYQMGCEIKTAISKMVARPEDLMGKGGTPDSEARRHGAMVEKYKSGTPNTKIQGMNASDVGE